MWRTNRESGMCARCVDLRCWLRMGATAASFVVDSRCSFVARPRRKGRRRRVEGTVANQLGKRFFCDVCETEVLCTKAGPGAVQCCEKDMELREPKPLPSAD